jgi:hypothetical protein
MRVCILCLNAEPVFVLVFAQGLGVELLVAAGVFAPVILITPSVLLPPTFADALIEGGLGELHHNFTGFAEPAGPIAFVGGLSAIA